tara:strand:+ start:145 stop:669 length:525 start_codon:yes stop_codon:yes gene_type:complete
MKDDINTIKRHIEELQSEIDKSKDNFKKKVKNFDLKKFLKLLNTKSNEDVFSLLIEASGQKNSKNNDSIKYHDLAEVIQLGNIFPLVSDNFTVKKIYEDIEELDTAFTIDHTFVIVFSKINKYFYIINSRKIIDIENLGLKFLKKFKDLKDAMNFIKKEIKVIKKDSKWVENRG